jgi:hypothetical protein
MKGKTKQKPISICEYHFKICRRAGFNPKEIELFIGF